MHFLPIDDESWSDEFITFGLAVIFSNFAHNMRFINVFSSHYFKFSQRANTLYFKYVPNIYGAQVLICDRHESKHLIEGSKYIN